MSTATLTHSGAWTTQARCLGMDPRLWYLPDGESTPNPDGNRFALAVCASCPVRQPCLTTALATHDVGVIRGGVRLPCQSYRSAMCRTCGREFRRVGPHSRVMHCPEHAGGASRPGGARC